MLLEENQTKKTLKKNKTSFNFLSLLFKLERNLGSLLENIGNVGISHITTKMHTLLGSMFDVEKKAPQHFFVMQQACAFKSRGLRI